MKRYKKINYKKIILKKLQWLIQFTYIMTFFFLTFGITGNIELDVHTPKHFIVIWIITGILTYFRAMNASNKIQNI